MEASPRKHGMYYRCPARTLAPGSPALASHPPAIYLREDPVREAANDWLGGLFARENVDRTVAALLGSQGDERGSREAVKARLANAEAQVRRFQSAIAAGVDPVALVESINSAQAERAALRAELDNLPTGDTRTDGEIYARIDQLTEMGTGLAKSDPDRLASFYTAVDLRVCYDHETGTADVTIEPLSRVNSECVRGGTSTPTVERSPLFGVITPKTIAVRHSRCHATTPISSRPIRTEDVSIRFAEWGYIPTPGNRKPTIARALHLFSDPGACIAAGGPDATRPVLTRPSWSAPSIQDTRRVVQSAAARISATRRRWAGSSSAQTPGWTRRVHTSISRVPYRRWSSSRQLMTWTRRSQPGRSGGPRAGAPTIGPMPYNEITGPTARG
jgi:hypothetical protein